MSKKNKVEKANKLINENKHIKLQIKSLISKYNYNQGIVKTLYKKAQIDSSEMESGYDKYSSEICLRFSDDY